MRQTNKKSFTFTDNELQVIFAYLYYQACDGDDMTPEAFKIVRKLTEKFEKITSINNIGFEVWKYTNIIFNFYQIQTQQ